MTKIKRLSERWFVWGPQWFYSWPIKIVRGSTEDNWHTIGVVTWAGSIFFCTSRCTPETCDEYEPPYDYGDDDDQDDAQA